MPPILDLQYESRIPRCRDVISLGLALQEYVSKFFANGAQPAGALVTTERLSKGARAALPGQLASLLWILTACAKTAILDGGLIYQPFASPNDHAQLTDVMQVIRLENCGASDARRGRPAICHRRAMPGQSHSDRPEPSYRTEHGRAGRYFSVHDVRKKLGESPVEGGDVYCVNSALIPASEAGKGEDAA